MVAVPKIRMSVSEYMAWAQSHPGRYELANGEVIAMSPEGAGHAAVKYAVQTALLGVQAARENGFPWGTWAGSLNLFVWLVVGAQQPHGSFGKGEGSRVRDRDAVQDLPGTN